MAGVNITASLNGLSEVTGGLGQIQEKMRDVGRTQSNDLAPSFKATSDAANDSTAKTEVLGFSLIRLGGIAATAGAAISAGIAAAVVGLAVAMLPSIQAVSQLSSELQDLSERTGVSGERLSGYGFALRQSNSSVQDFAGGIRELSKNLEDSSNANDKAARAMRSLGIDAVDPTTGKLRTAEEVMLDVADRFSQMEDGAGKTAIAVALFGGAGERLIPFLNQGSVGIAELRAEAERLGITLTNDTIKAGDAFDKNLKAISESASAMGMQLASSVMPALAELTAQMRLGANEGGILGGVFAGLKEILGTALFGRSPLLGPTKAEITESLKDLDALQEGINETQRKIKTGSSTPGLVSELKDLEAAYAKQQEKVIQMTGYEQLLGDLRTTNARAEAPRIEARTAKLKEAVDKELDFHIGYFAAQVKLQEIDAVDYEAWLEMRLAGTEANTQEHVRLLNALHQVRQQRARDDAATDKQREQEYKDYTDVYKNNVHAQADAHKEVEDALKRVGGVNASVAADEIRAINDSNVSQTQKLALLEELRQKYMLMGNAGQTAMDNISGAIARTKTDTELFGEAMERIWGKAGFDIVGVIGGVHRSWTGTLSGMLQGKISFMDGVKGMWGSLVDTIITEFARLAINQVFKWLFGGESPARPSFFDMLINGFQSVSGAATASGGVMSGVLSSIGSGLTSLTTSFGSVISSIGSGISSVATSIGNLFTGGSGAGVGGWGDDEEGGGGSEGGGLGGIGILGAIGGIGTQLVGGVNNVIGGISNFLGIGGGAGAGVGGWGTNELSGFLGGIEGAGGALGGLGDVLPYAGSILQLLQGNVVGAAGSAIGTLIGNMILPGVGGVVGGFLGGLLGGGDEPDSIGTGYDWNGVYTFGAGLSLTAMGNTSTGPHVMSTGPHLEEFTTRIEALLGPLAASEALQGIAIPFHFHTGLNTADYGEGNPNSANYAGLLAAQYVAQGLAQQLGIVTPMASGADFITSSPRLIQVGERGPERVRVDPLGAGDNGRSGGVTVNVQGPFITDQFGMKLFIRDLQRRMSSGMAYG